MTRDQFDALAPLLPRAYKGADDGRLRLISGVVHVLLTGLPWRQAPAAHGTYNTIYGGFTRWAERGLWEPLFVALEAAGGPPAEPLIRAVRERLTSGS